MTMTTRRELLIAAGTAGLSLCGAGATSAQAGGGDTASEAGVRWIALANGHRVWTQRQGRGPRKVLLLHGGLGLPHDYMECFADFLPPAGYEMYFYGQLGCGRSDHPDDAALWTLPRYLDEVEQLRSALGLEHFVLIGHSWGAMLGIEYALQHPERLDGLVLSNMSASFRDHGAYVHHLRDTLPPTVRGRLAALEAANAQSGDEYGTIVREQLYSRYVCRLAPWPAALLRSLAGMNAGIYNQMQGPDEFTLTGNLKDWDRWADLKRIATPTLVMGARFDEMNPNSIRREARLIRGASLFMSDSGSHLAMWDDQRRYFAALLAFLGSLPPRP